MSEICSQRHGLTGAWSGVYIDSLGRATKFLAHLRELDCTISGEAVEPRRGRGLSFRCSTLAGSRRGGDVRFAKLYQQPSRDYLWPMLYSGTIAAGEMQIHGKFALIGETGTFLMIREDLDVPDVIGTERARHWTRSRPLDLTGGAAEP